MDTQGVYRGCIGLELPCLIEVNALHHADVQPRGRHLGAPRQPLAHRPPGSLRTSTRPILIVPARRMQLGECSYIREGEEAKRERDASAITTMHQTFALAPVRRRRRRCNVSGVLVLNNAPCLGPRHMSPPMRLGGRVMLPHPAERGHVGLRFAAGFDARLNLAVGATDYSSTFQPNVSTFWDTLCVTIDQNSSG